MDGLPIQPLAGALAGTPHAQAAQSTQRAAQIRRTQNLAKVSSLNTDTLERQVESADAIDAIHGKPDEQPSHRRKRQPQPPKDDSEPPHIDLTA